MSNNSQLLSTTSTSRAKMSLKVVQNVFLGVVLFVASAVSIFHSSFILFSFSIRLSGIIELYCLYKKVVVIPESMSKDFARLWNDCNRL